MGEAGSGGIGRGRLAAWTLAAALLAGGLSLLHLRRGIPITADGWAYWQGSVSLLAGEGYTDLLGRPILDWPPGYPLYLAAWQALLGVSGRTLVFSTAAAAALAAALWLLLHAWAGRWRCRPMAPWLPAATALYLGLFLATHDQRLLEVGPGLARYDPLTYLWQAVKGLGELLGPFPLGILLALALAAWALRAGGPRRRILAWQALAALLALYAIFNLAWVHDRLRDRFLYFLPVTLAPLGLEAAGRIPRPWLRTLALAALLGPIAIPALRFAWAGRGPAAIEPVPAVLEKFAANRFTLDRNRLVRPWLVEGERIYVVPPEPIPLERLKGE